MNELSDAILATELPVPMDALGWGIFLVSLLITVGWLLYLYR